MTEESAKQQLDVARLLAALRRRKRIIAAVALAMGGMALVLSVLQTPLYEGEARIALDPPGAAAVFEPVTAAARIDPAVVVETELEVLKSDAVQDLVAEQLGPVPEVQAARVGDTLLIEVNGHSSDPERAAAVTNAYVQSYLDLRRQQAADDLLATGDQLRTKVAELQSQIDNLDPDASVGQREALVEQQARFSERLNQLEIEAALQSGGGQVVNEADVPDAPVSPTPVRNTALALVVGSLLGAGVALVAEYRDDTIKTQDDLSDVIKPLPVLGTIPLVAAWHKEGWRPHLIAHQTDSLHAGESYRALRTAVSLLGVERPLSVVQFTSALPADGKTTTLANLGVVLATAGQRVVMVDCDLRRPSLHAAFEMANTVGFTSVLTGEVELTTAIQPIRTEGQLALLSSGGLAPNPSELLGSKRTSEVLFALQSDFDVVLVDSPPVLSVTDAAVLSVWVDAILFVTSAGITTRKHLRSAMEVLRQAGAPLGGAVLNRVDARSSGYNYGYYEDRPEGPRHRSPRRKYRSGMGDSGDQRSGEPSPDSGESNLWLFPRRG